mgnify:CR=1 FL=1
MAEKLETCALALQSMRFDMMRLSRADAGSTRLHSAVLAFGAEFAPEVKNWVDVKLGEGRDDLLAAWLEVLSGRVDPRVGHVVAL